MKKEQLIIRLSSELKSEIKKAAKDDGVSISEFARQSFFDALNENNNSSIEERLSGLEIDSLEGRWRDYIPKFNMSMAHVISIINGEPIDTVILRLFELLEKHQPPQSEVIMLPRIRREQSALNLSSLVTREFQLSTLGQLIIETMILGIFGFLYNETVVQPYPLAMNMMGLMKSVLNEIS